MLDEDLKIIRNEVGKLTVIRVLALQQEGDVLQPLPCQSTALKLLLVPGSMRVGGWLGSTAVLSLLHTCAPCSVDVLPNPTASAYCRAMDVADPASPSLP